MFTIVCECDWLRKFKNIQECSSNFANVSDYLRMFVECLCKCSEMLANVSEFSFRRIFTVNFTIIFSFLLYPYLYLCQSLSIASLFSLSCLFSKTQCIIVWIKQLFTSNVKEAFLTSSSIKWTVMSMDFPFFSLLFRNFFIYYLLNTTNFI